MCARSDTYVVDILKLSDILTLDGQVFECVTRSLEVCDVGLEINTEPVDHVDISGVKRRRRVR